MLRRTSEQLRIDRVVDALAMLNEWMLAGSLTPLRAEAISAMRDMMPCVHAAIMEEATRIVRDLKAGHAKGDDDG